MSADAFTVRPFFAGSISGNFALSCFASFLRSIFFSPFCWHSTLHVKVLSHEVSVLTTLYVTGRCRQTSPTPSMQQKPLLISFSTFPATSLTSTCRTAFVLHLTQSPLIKSSLENLSVQFVTNHFENWIKTEVYKVIHCVGRNPVHHQSQVDLGMLKTLWRRVQKHLGSDYENLLCLSPDSLNG